MSDILTIPGVAQALDVSDHTARRLVVAGTITGFRVRRQWRIRRSALDAYITHQQYVAQQQRGEPVVTPSVRHLKGWDTFR